MNLVFIIDEPYVMPLAVACLSLTLYTTRPLQVFVIELGLSSQSKDILRGILPDSSLCFVHCRVSSPFVAKLMLASHLPMLSKILYLDADILIRSNIEYLWDLVQDAELIAAATDVGESTTKRQCFNAGVMFLNLAAIRADNIEEEMLQWVRNHAGGKIDLSVFRWQDQDVFNHFFAGRWRQFPLSWNAQGIDSYAQFRVTEGLITETYLRHLQSNADLVHFTGAAIVSLDQFNAYCPMPTKPWSGHVYSQGASGKPLSYVKEWFRLLHSIPAFRSWWPDIPAIKRRLRQAVNETTARLKTNIDSLRIDEEESMKKLTDEPKLLAVLLPILTSN